MSLRAIQPGPAAPSKITTPPASQASRVTAGCYHRPFG